MIGWCDPLSVIRLNFQKWFNRGLYQSCIHFRSGMSNVDSILVKSLPRISFKTTKGFRRVVDFYWLTHAVVFLFLTEWGRSGEVGGVKTTKEECRMQIITDSRFTSIPNVITDSSLCALSQHTRVSHISNRTKKDNKQMKKKTRNYIE